MKSIFTIVTLLFLSIGAVHAQELQATETKALLEVVVTDFSDHPRPNEIVIFHAEKANKDVKRVTGKDGKFKILLPKGDTYSIKYKSFLDEKKSSQIEIPNEEGIMEATLTVQMETADKDVFELDIHFETDKAIIRKESFHLLDDVVEQMKLKPAIKIEVVGHTDNVGDDAYNQTLSEKRAASVKQYLVDHGVAAARVQTKGLGESRPKVANDSDANRAINRRTEVRVIAGLK